MRWRMAALEVAPAAPSPTEVLSPTEGVAPTMHACAHVVSSAFP